MCSNIRLDLERKVSIYEMDSFGLFVALSYEECSELSELINVANKIQVPASRNGFDQMCVSWVVTQSRIRRFGRTCWVHISC